MHITLQLQKDHEFENQIHRKFSFQKGSQLSGHLRLFTSTWPFGIYHHDSAGKLGVEFIFPYSNETWIYRGFVDCRELWPPPGAKVTFPNDTDLYYVGPMLGMRDDRDDYHYILSDGSKRVFRLKYVGFECWVTFREATLNIKIRHFLPANGHVVIGHSIPVEDLLFHKELKLSYGADGFLDDGWQPHPFVRVEQCA